MRLLSGLLALLLPLPSFAADCGFAAACPSDAPLCVDAEKLGDDADALAFKRKVIAGQVTGADLTALNLRYRALRERVKSDVFKKLCSEKVYDSADCVRLKLNVVIVDVLPPDLVAQAQPRGAVAVLPQPSCDEA